MPATPEDVQEMNRMPALAGRHPYDMTKAERDLFARRAEAFADTRPRQEAEQIRQKAAFIQMIDHPAPRTWSAKTLSSKPAIRPAVLERLQQKAKEGRDVIEWAKEYYARAHGNDPAKTDDELNAFLGCEHRDLAKMIVFPDRDMSPEQRKTFTTEWLNFFRTPAGRKKYTTEFLDRIDRLDHREFDLSCLSADGDHTPPQQDGLTASEHDFMDSLWLYGTTQTRGNTERFISDIFGEHYRTERARALFHAGTERDIRGIGPYYETIFRQHGIDFSSMTPTVAMDAPADTEAAEAHASIYDKRSAAVLEGDTSVLRDHSLELASTEDMTVELAADLEKAISVASSGKPLTVRDQLLFQRVYAATVVPYTSINDTIAETHDRALGLHDIDRLFVDGQPLTDFVGHKYSDLAAARATNDAATVNKIVQAMQAEYIAAAVSGKHRTEVAEIGIGPNDSYQVDVVAFKMDSHILDDAEKKAGHNAARRAFDFGASRIETRADKQDKLWQNDPDRQKRQEGIKARIGDRILAHAYLRDGLAQAVAPTPIPRGQYRMAQTTMSEDEMYTPNKAQVKHDITISNRQAAKQVFGAEIYDAIDEARKGTASEREITLHSRRGSKQLAQGEPVLEIDFAGSDYARLRKDYKGLVPKYKDEGKSDPEIAARLDAIYGKQVPGRKHVRVKESTVPLAQPANGITSMSKQRISIGGPSGVNLRVEDYSLDHNREYAVSQITGYLEKQLSVRNAERGVRPLKPIHINLTGHSRGACSAGETVRYVNEWLQKNPNHYPQEVLDCVRFDVVQYDPVPGFGDRTKHGKLDFNDIPGVNSTVVYSLSSEHGDMSFTPQQVKGANRIIFGVMAHSVKLGETDRSQVDEHAVEGNKMAYFDPETGEVYRGSGLSELKDGIYFTDERANLIRVTSLSQIDQLADTIFEGNDGRQKLRLNVIRNSAKDWFVNHDLELSYPSNEQRARGTEKFAKLRQELVADANSPELGGIRTAIGLLDQAERTGDKDAIIESHEKLREECRKYMKDIELPSDAATEKKLAMVGDILSYAQRERNFLEHGLDKSAVKERTGAVTRQIEREEERLQKEGKLQYTTLETAERSKELLARLDATHKSGADSKSYTRLHDALDKVSKLNGNASVNEIQEAMDELAAAGKSYDKEHDSVRKGRSALGKERRAISQLAAKLGETAGTDFREQSKEIADRHLSVDQLLESRGKKVEALHTKKKLTCKELTSKAEAAHEIHESPSRQKPQKVRQRRGSVAGTSKELAETKAQLKSAPPVVRQTS